MEGISSIITQHFGSLFGMFVANHINTGNRSADNSIQMILNTLFGVFIIYFSTFIFKGGWRTLFRKWGIISWSPLNFKADSVTVPKDFTFSMIITDVDECEMFAKWMIQLNSDKLTSGNILISSSFKTLVLKPNVLKKLELDNEDSDEDDEDENCPSESEYNSQAVVQTVLDALITPKPVWLGSDGEFVFACKGSKNLSNDVANMLDVHNSCSVSFQSNSKKALEELSTEILKLDPEIKKEIVDSNKLIVYQVELPRNEHIPNAKISLQKMGFINSRKTFEHLHFTEKKTLVNLLKKFSTRSLYKDNIPMENKLGILLHGPPGTGKSGVIQAIANYTKRNVIMINLNNITTCKALDQILLADSKKNIFVFEEIDCVGGLVAKRDPKNPKHTESDDSKSRTEDLLLAVAMGNHSSKPGMDRSFADRNKGKLNLGYLLQKLDGLTCNENSIFIATTNHPETLDPALVRPGRFGMKLNLSYCTRQMLVDIIGMMLSLDLNDKLELERNIPPLACDVWSPVEIIQQCCIDDSVKAILNFLNNSKAERC